MPQELMMDLVRIHQALVSLGRTYPLMKGEARYQWVMSTLEMLIAEYDAKNREWTEHPDQPTR